MNEVTQENLQEVWMQAKLLAKHMKAGGGGGKHTLPGNILTHREKAAGCVRMILNPQWQQRTWEENRAMS